MFTRSFPLFSIFGFRISIDLSWFVLAALIVWSLATGLFPEYLPDRSAQTYYVMGTVAALGMFASIVFHELAHSLVARLYGIKIAGITLFIFGGVAELEDEPPTPKSEFLVAIAGPISSVVLGGALYLIASLVGDEQPTGSARRAQLSHGHQHRAGGVQPHPGLSAGWRTHAPSRAMVAAGRSAQGNAPCLVHGCGARHRADGVRRV